MICKACGYTKNSRIFTELPGLVLDSSVSSSVCPKNLFGAHDYVEKPFKPRVTKYQIKTTPKTPYSLTVRQTIARWDKKNGLLWRVTPSKSYGVDSLDNYWKVTEASQSGILSAIRQTGEYIANQSLDFHEGAELLDLLNQALAGTLDP